MKRYETGLTLWGDIWLRVNPLSLSSYSNLFEPTQLGHYRDLQTLSLSLSLLQISALTPLRLLMERRRQQGRQGGAPPAPPVDFCERPLRPITKFERSVIDVIRYVRYKEMETGAI